MATNNAEGLNFKVVTTGNPIVDSRQPCNLRRLTLAKLVEWIESKDLEAEIKAELRKSASVYPENALEHWQKNFTKHVLRARQATRGLRPKPPERVEERAEETTQARAETPPRVEEFD